MKARIALWCVVFRLCLGVAWISRIDAVLECNGNPVLYISSWTQQAGGTSWINELMIENWKHRIALAKVMKMRIWIQIINRGIVVITINVLKKKEENVTVITVNEARNGMGESECIHCNKLGLVLQELANYSFPCSLYTPLVLVLVFYRVQVIVFPGNPVYFFFFTQELPN